MSDSTVRTLRTIVQAVITVLLWLAAYLPSLLDDLGVKQDQWPGLALLVAMLAAVTRLSQSGLLDRLLTGIGLGKDAASSDLSGD